MSRKIRTRPRSMTPDCWLCELLSAYTARAFADPQIKENEDESFFNFVCNALAEVMTDDFAEILLADDIVCRELLRRGIERLLEEVSGGSMRAMTNQAPPDELPDPWSVPIEYWPAASILPAADGTWQPAPEQPSDEGIECSLYQLTEFDGSLYDVVAWEVAGNGSIWWLRWGRATHLGEWCIELANRDSKPIWLVRTPREYLKHVPLACCILNWRADIGPILGQVRHGIICKSPALAERARRAVDRRPSQRLKISMVAA
jgi:hypothetical protein